MKRMHNDWLVCAQRRFARYAAVWAAAVCLDRDPTDRCGCLDIAMTVQGEGADGEDMRLGQGHDIVRRMLCC